MKNSYLMLLVIAVFACSPDKPKFDNPVDSNGTNFLGYAAPVLAGPAKGRDYELTWTDVGADSYTIQEAKTSDFSDAASFSISSLSKEFSHTVTGEKYYYRVRTNTGNKDSGWSNNVYVVIEETPFEKIKIQFVSIPGGTFQMGDVENAGYSNEKPVHSVTVSDFEMGVYEITNAQYAMYLNDAKGSGDITANSSSVTGAKGAYSGQEYINLSDSYDTNNKCWITYNDGSFSVVSGKEKWPVVYVTWYGAKAFALYYGLDLPTEAEWEYACRGGKQYKYGTDDGTISSSKANYNSNIGYPVDVGSYPANPYGLRDMSGNVWEWCHDWYAGYTSSSQNNPSGAQTGSPRVLRGGGWHGYGPDCRSASRSYGLPDYRHYYMGFRVVRRVSPQNY